MGEPEHESFLAEEAVGEPLNVIGCGQLALRSDDNIECDADVAVGTFDVNHDVGTVAPVCQ